MSLYVFSQTVCKACYCKKSWWKQSASSNVNITEKVKTCFEHYLSAGPPGRMYVTTNGRVLCQSSWEPPLYTITNTRTDWNTSPLSNLSKHTNKYITECTKIITIGLISMVYYFHLKSTGFDTNYISVCTYPALQSQNYCLPCVNKSRLSLI